MDNILKQKGSNTFITKVWDNLYISKSDGRAQERGLGRSPPNGQNRRSNGLI